MRFVPYCCEPSYLIDLFHIQFGLRKVVELKEGGASIPITQDNKREFVQLSAQYRLYSSIKDQINALLGGFYEIIPKELISIVRMFTDVRDIILIHSLTVQRTRGRVAYLRYTRHRH
jgi:hypothetical protein